MAGELKTESESSDFKEQVYRFVKNIPNGKVATYGQIAYLIMYSQGLKSQKSNIKKQNYRSFTPGVKGDYTPGVFLALAVGNALHQNKDPKVPCHRVVDRNGRLAPNFAFNSWREQCRRLRVEGVKFKNEMHVDLEECLW